MQAVTLVVALIGVVMFCPFDISSTDILRKDNALKLPCIKRWKGNDCTSTVTRLKELSNMTRDKLLSESNLHPFRTFNSEFFSFPETGEFHAFSKLQSNPLLLKDLTELFVDSDKPKLRNVALIGPPGSGKTEFMKTLLWELLKKLGDSQNSIFTISLNLRNMRKKTLSLSEFVLGKFPTDKVSLDCLKTHPIFLIFEDIDDHITTASAPMLLDSIKHEANMETILKNILLGELLPNVKALFSSYEKTALQLNSSIRPGRIINLKGLSKAAVEDTLRRNGIMHQHWSHLETFPSFYNPTFLNIVISHLKQCINCYFKSETDLLLHVIRPKYLLKGKKSQYAALQKLMDISFELTKRGDELFYGSDNSLTKEDKQLFKDSGLIKGRGLYRFTIQPIRELLASLFVIGMSSEKFHSFSGHLNTYRWAGVRKMSMDILLNPSTQMLLGGSLNPGKLSKSKELTQTLRKELEKLQTSGQYKSDYLKFLSILTQFNKTAKEVFASSLRQMNFVNVPLTNKELDVLLFSINYAEQMMFVNLINCGIDNEILIGLARSFTRSYAEHINLTKVKILVLGNYQELQLDGVMNVVHILPYVSDIFWLGYRINEAGRILIQEKMDIVKKPQKIYLWTLETQRLVILAPKKQADRKDF